MYNVYIMPESSVLTLRLDAKLKNQLDRLSKSMNRSRLFRRRPGYPGFVSVMNGKLRNQEGVVEADPGDFASDKDMEQTLRRLTRRAR